VDGFRAWQEVSYRRLGNDILNTLYAEKEVVWIGTSRGIVRWSRESRAGESHSFRTLISEVRLKNDSVLPGDYLQTDAFLSGLRRGMLHLSNKKNAIELYYRSTDYNSHSQPLFQYKIEGIDENWSEWTENTSTHLANLPPGRYTFTVRSQDIYGNISASDSFAFRILPPLYASIWAFILYALMVLFILYAFQKWRTFQHVRERYKLEKIIEERTEALVEEKEKSETLLANILPKQTMDELKAKGKATSSKFKMVTVLFADIQGFTKIAEQMNPDMLIDELDRFYFQFDSVVEKYNIEKIKTIGDAYMAAGGIPIKNRTNPVEVVLAALEMQHYMQKLKESKTDIWDLRIGMHTGSVIAGVVGQKKLSYDIWGDSVNTASRMESSGEVGRVNISVTTYELVKDFFDCEYRGKMPVKYKGDIEMYFVNGLKEQYAAEENHAPNKEFLTQIQLLRLLDLEEYIYFRLENELPEDLYFHNVNHTAHVYTQTELIGRGEKVGEEDLLILRTAALLHDIGYIDTFDGHEERSVELAREILPTYKYSEEQTTRICKLILATKLNAQPEDLLDQIIIDANMDHLGRVDFLIQSDKLFQEYRMQNKIKTKKDWNNSQIELLSQFNFHTSIARKLREVSGEQQIENIRQFS
jgi:putative nucleotidyltransferase with HDIG domain